MATLSFPGDCDLTSGSILAESNSDTLACKELEITGFDFVTWSILVEVTEISGAVFLVLGFDSDVGKARGGSGGSQEEEEGDGEG